LESIYHIIHSALYDPNGEPRAEQVSRATGDGFTELVLEVVSPAFLARRGISKYHINVVWSHTKERPLRKAGHTGCLPPSGERPELDMEGEVQRLLKRMQKEGWLLAGNHTMKTTENGDTRFSVVYHLHRS